MFSDQQLIILGICMSAAMLFIVSYFLRNAEYPSAQLRGSLHDAIHRELLREMPGICRGEFSLVESVNGMSSDDIVNVHGVGERDFFIRVWHKTIDGKVKITNIEAKSDDAVSKLMQCKFAAKRPFMK